MSTSAIISFSGPEFFFDKGVRTDEIGSCRVLLGGVVGEGVVGRSAPRALFRGAFDTRETALRLRVGEVGTGGKVIFLCWKDVKMRGRDE